ALDDYIGVGTDYRILRGLIKILLDRCRFETRCVREAAEIRRLLFFRTGQQDQVVAEDGLRRQLIAEAASELECTADEVTEGLYADLDANQRLVDVEEMSPLDLLDRYNLAQAQALLYRCAEMQLWIDAKEPAVIRRLFTEIKAFRLIHAIKGNPKTGF